MPDLRDLYELEWNALPLLQPASKDQATEQRTAAKVQQGINFSEALTAKINMLTHKTRAHIIGMRRKMNQELKSCFRLYAPCSPVMEEIVCNYQNCGIIINIGERYVSRLGNGRGARVSKFYHFRCAKTLHII